MTPKKSLGQHWLRSNKAIDEIIKASDLKAEDMVLEIGPGEGTLTEKLLGRGCRVITIEKDRRLIPLLQKKFEKEIKNGKLKIIEEDILNYKVPLVNYKLVANIPYYITGQVIRKFLGNDNKPKLMVLLLQKEVAERIVAKDKKESLLSISVKAYGEPKYGGVIKAGSFYPRPKVDSGIIKITPLIPLTTRGRPGPKFFNIVRAGFAHKRKLLIKNLEVIEKNKEKLKEVFKKLGIPEKVRAEDLTVLQWFQISDII